MEEKYPDGKCEDCGKIFKRPNKFKTESEGWHINGCRLTSIENAIKNKEDFNVYELIEDVERISKISSFGGTMDKKYLIRMKRCQEIINKLKEINSL